MLVADRVAWERSEGPGPVLRRSVGWGHLPGAAVTIENQADLPCGWVSSEVGWACDRSALSRDAVGGDTTWEFPVTGPGLGPGTSQSKARLWAVAWAPWKTDLEPTARLDARLGNTAGPGQGWPDLPTG